MTDHLTRMLRFATNVFPKYENNPQWVYDFLSSFEAGGEDAIEKGFQAFELLAKQKGLTADQRSAVRKFSTALAMMREVQPRLKPADERAIQRLLRPRRRR